MNLADAVRDFVPNCRILSIGSAEVYGGANSAADSFREDATLRPENPYAVGRLAQEQMSRIYVDGFGMNIITTRSFNHVGPGQNPRFAIASFVKQLADAGRLGEKKVVMSTGNVDLVRDISDVRDVVRAYLLLLSKGKPGEIYNVGRGEGFSLRNIIKTAANILGLDVVIAVDRNLLRPTDPQYLVGSIEKIHHETGWRPQIPMEQTLRDMLESFTAPNVIAR